MQLSDRTRNEAGNRSRSTQTVRFVMLWTGGITVIGHYYLLRMQSIDWTQTPISALSQNGKAVGHAALLCAFATAQGLLAIHVRTAKSGWLTRSIQTLCVLTAVLIACLGWIFTVDSSALHTFMLSLLASLAGVIMGCLIARDKGISERAAAYRINVAAFAIWIVLTAIAFIVSDSHVGAYQRSVGAVYIAWLCALALIPTHSRNQSA